MMNFIEIAKKRYSVRNYSSKKVEKEKLDKILQAAHVAPTAANLQPVHLIAVESKEGLEKISKGANIYNAPLAIIVCADHNKAWVRPFDQKQTGDIDAAILTDHMMLEATELGLGTVWVCYFQPDVEMSRNVQSGNTQNLKSSAASDQAAVCACARSRYFAGGSPSGLRV